MRTVCALAAAVIVLAGCGQDIPATEVLVTVDATADVAMKTDSLQVQISGSDSAMGPFNGTVTQGFGSPTEAVRFPRVFALVPARGDPRRHFQVLAVARQGTTVITTAIVRSGYLEHRLLHLTLLLDETACEHPCMPGETCRSGRCEPIGIDPMGLVDGGTNLGTRPDGATHDAPTSDAPLDASSDGGGPPDGGFDADIDAGCSTASCDDHVSCTRDVCDTGGACTHVADNALCSAIADGTCDPVLDCQYPTCTPSVCVPDADNCMDAVCSGSICMRVSLCHSGLVCCHGSCVEPGCDDGDRCTDDRCGGAMCLHTFNVAPCDDGSACTINDTCAGGVCSGVADCDDHNLCTDDSCDPMAGCQHFSNFMECASDPLSCIYTTCDATNTCRTTFCALPSMCCSGACIDFMDPPPVC